MTFFTSFIIFSVGMPTALASAAVGKLSLCGERTGNERQRPQVLPQPIFNRVIQVFIEELFLAAQKISTPSGRI